MELELGLKLTKTRDDVSSSTDFRVSTDPFGSVSISRETESAFILTIHLKGFKKEGIDIEINKDGNRIKISGTKPVEEMILTKWMAWKKEVEIKSFKKVFRIPKIVDLDRIKARFNDEERTLKIKLPKRVKGITGLKIEEEDEEEEPVAEPQEEQKEEVEEEKEPEEVAPPPQEENIKEEKTEEVMEDPKPEEEEKDEPERNEEEDKIDELVEEEAEREEVSEVIEEKEKDEGNEKRRRRRRKRCRFPFLAGSSLLMSIIFFIIHLIESKSKKK